MGPGTNCLLTFRQLSKAEMSTNGSNVLPNAESLSRQGCVGRILYGVLQKLFVVLKMQGALANHGDLADSVSQLAILIMNLIQNFNMDSVTKFDSWCAVVSKGIEDMVLSKHMQHLKAMKNISREISDYIDPYLTILLNIQVRFFWKKIMKIIPEQKVPRMKFIHSMLLKYNIFILWTGPERENFSNVNPNQNTLPNPN